MSFLKTLLAGLGSDNAKIGRLLNTPVEDPALPESDGNISPKVSKIISENPRLRYAIKLRPDLVERIDRYPFLADELNYYIGLSIDSYRSIINNKTDYYRKLISDKKKLKYVECVQVWDARFREDLFYKTLKSNEMFSTLCEDAENDVLAGSAFKQGGPSFTFPQCRYALTKEGIGILLLNGEYSEQLDKHYFSISFNSSRMIIKSILPESAQYRRTENVIFSCSINYSLQSLIEAHSDGVLIGFYSDGETISNKLMLGNLEKIKSNGPKYYNNEGITITKFYVDIGSNRVVKLPDEWLKLQNHPGSWVISIAHILFPYSEDGKVKALQHRLRTIVSEIWAKEFTKRKKQVPPLPLPLGHEPNWEDVEREADRPVNAGSSGAGGGGVKSASETFFGRQPKADTP
jgi:hypothetical protein